MTRPKKTTKLQAQLYRRLFKYLYSEVIKGKKLCFILNGIGHFMNLIFS